MWTKSEPFERNHQLTWLATSSSRGRRDSSFNPNPVKPQQEEIPTEDQDPNDLYLDCIVRAIPPPGVTGRGRAELEETVAKTFCLEEFC
jgi:hypothetical protein